VAEYFDSRNKKEDSDTLRIREKGFVENSLSAPLSRLSESLLAAKKNSKDKENELELASFIRKINALKDSADLIVNQPLENYVYWAESSRNKKINRVSINMAPVNIGKYCTKSF